MRHEYSFDAQDILEVHRSLEKQSSLRQFICDAAAKEFLDLAKGEAENYEACLVGLPGPCGMVHRGL